MLRGGPRGELLVHVDTGGLRVHPVRTLLSPSGVSPVGRPRSLFHCGLPLKARPPSGGHAGDPSERREEPATPVSTAPGESRGGFPTDLRGRTCSCFVMERRPSASGRNGLHRRWICGVPLRSIWFSVGPRTDTGRIFGAAVGPPAARADVIDQRAAEALVEPSREGPPTSVRDDRRFVILAEPDREAPAAVIGRACRVARLAATRDRFIVVRGGEQGGAGLAPYPRALAADAPGRIRPLLSSPVSDVSLLASVLGAGASRDTHGRPRGTFATERRHSTVRSAARSTKRASVVTQSFTVPREGAPQSTYSAPCSYASETW